MVTPGWGKCTEIAVVLDPVHREVSVHCYVRQGFVSEQLNEQGHLVACLVWVTRHREDLSGAQDATHGSQTEGLLIKSADEPPILIVDVRVRNVLHR